MLLLLLRGWSEGEILNGYLEKCHIFLTKICQFPYYHKISVTVSGIRDCLLLQSTISRQQEISRLKLEKDVVKCLLSCVPIKQKADRSTACFLLLGFQ